MTQGDLLSPMLFNIVMDMLAILIMRVKEDGQVDGLMPHLVDCGIFILQDTDDTIIFIEHNLEKALNMKQIVCIFEKLLGLKINFHKSEVFFSFDKAKDVEVDYINLFGCEGRYLPCIYLGISTQHHKLNSSEWKAIEDREKLRENQQVR
jgi:hypothetical protein